MDYSTWSAVAIMLFVVFVVVYTQQRSAIRLAVMRMQKRRKGGRVMSETLQYFIGKKCTISTAITSPQNLTGVVMAIEGNWLKVKTGKMDRETIHMVNTDYISKICEAAR